MPPKKAVGKAIQKVKKVTEVVRHRPFLKTYVMAQGASAAPPLGTQLAARQINVAQWTKEFNERTEAFEIGVPIPTRTYVNEDKSYRLDLYHPPMSMLLKKAAGIQRGVQQQKHEFAGKISLKHVYHIAEMKRQDHDNDKYSLKEICEQVIIYANRAGIQILPHVTAEEIGAFQEYRKPIIEEQLKEWEAKRSSKFLRSGVEDSTKKNR